MRLPNSISCLRATSAPNFPRCCCTSKLPRVSSVAQNAMDHKVVLSLCGGVPSLRRRDADVRTRVPSSPPSCRSQAFQAGSTERCDLRAVLPRVAPARRRYSQQFLVDVGANLLRSRGLQAGSSALYETSSPLFLAASMGRRCRYRSDYVRMFVTHCHGAPSLGSDHLGSPHGGVLITVLENDDAAFARKRGRVRDMEGDQRRFVHSSDPRSAVRSLG